MGCDMSTEDNNVVFPQNIRVVNQNSQKNQNYQNNNQNNYHQTNQNNYYQHQNIQNNYQNNPINYNQNNPNNQQNNQNNQQNNSRPLVKLQNDQQTRNVQISQDIKVNSRKVKKNTLKVTDRKGILQLYLNRKQSFLVHHLKNQVSIMKYAKADLIRRRQILQHCRFQQFLSRGYGTQIAFMNQCALKSYFQRIALQIFQTADKQFFIQNKSIDQVRFKIAQRYLFQLYQSKQFIDAGLGKYASTVLASQFQMSVTALSSDYSLYPILRYLKQKYPQVADKSAITFPVVKQKKQDVNLLQNFPSKCYSSPRHINIQTLFTDLKFMIDKSVQLFADFQSDMKAILGEQVLTDSKVKKVQKNGKQQYSASPVRRVFIKWAQTIIQRIPDIIYTQAFTDFIRSKSGLMDNFHFKSSVQPTSHAKVIQILCYLLQSAKYDIASLVQKKQFGFFIYDLLRCKIKRNTGEQICQVLKKMQQLKITPSGKKFEVVRIKDRFKTPNRDLMVNFRYGDIIVAEAQLCIDTSDVSEKTKKTNKFNHYIYQLQRGLFGPTVELMMQYQDFQRKDISANLQADGLVKQRIKKQPIGFLKKANRKCFNSHEMIQLKGNYFIKDQNSVYQQQIQMSCDYCSVKFSSSELYHYCYFCSIVYCLFCHQNYKKQNVKDLQIRCNREDLITPLKNQQQLQNTFKQSSIVLFHLSYGAPNVLFKDFITFLFCMYKLQKKQIPKIYSFCCDLQNTDKICQKYQIKEFPTMAIFSSNGTLQTKLIGSQFSLIQGMFAAQVNVAQNQPKGLSLTCCCGQQLVQVQNQQNQEFFCLYCGNVDKSEGFFDALLGQDTSRLFACANNHARCLKCSFLGDNQLSQFKDYRAKSYFTIKKQKISQKCKKGHNLTYVKDIVQSKHHPCIKCSNQFFFNDYQGAAFCKQCNGLICAKCIGIQDYPLQVCGTQLVNHSIESTAEQGERCICKRLFKKVYNTRDYTYNVLENRQQGEDRTRQYIESLFKDQKKNWKCVLCQRQKQDGQLHLACFLCPQFRQQKMNIQICIECAIGSDMLNKQLDQRITQKTTDYICQSKHPIVKTRLSYNSDDLIFNCVGCQKCFYIYSERYYCKICKTNTCLSCAPKKLTNSRPPKCLRKCNQNHNLIIKQDADTLRMCDGCRIVIRKQHFVCPVQCGFDLCLNCAATPPGVNTTNYRMQHVDQQKIKKQMEIYQKGYFQDVQEEQQNSSQGPDLGQIISGIDNFFS